jgi:hypothetical protein
MTGQIGAVAVIAALVTAMEQSGVAGIDEMLPQALASALTLEEAELATGTGEWTACLLASGRLITADRRGG